MEHKIETRITLEVVEVENDKCDGCYFDGFNCNKPKDWMCYSRERSDHKNVIFKEIKEE